MKRTLQSKPCVLFLVGPTGVGKTSLSFLLAKKLNGEIVSADSMLVYRGMNIGTAKPSAVCLRRIRHHLINIVSPAQDFSVFQYYQKAFQAIASICRKGKVPIVVGGSGLYIQALLDGLTLQPPGNPALRKKYAQLEQKHGLSYLYRRLKRIDPRRAAQIHPNDERRIFRALEVIDQSQKKQTDWKQFTPSLESLGYRFLIFGLIKDREALYHDIDQRVVGMLEAGWLQEAKRLSRKTLSRTARQAVGYRELLDLIKGHGTLQTIVPLIQRNSRRLAKKQLTWFRRDPRIQWFPIKNQKDLNGIAGKIVKIWNKYF